MLRNPSGHGLSSQGFPSKTEESRNIRGSLIRNIFVIAVIYFFSDRRLSVREMTKIYMSPTVEDDDSHNEYFLNVTKYRECDIEIPHPRVRSALPFILSKELKLH